MRKTLAACFMLSIIGSASAQVFSGQAKFKETIYADGKLTYVSIHAGAGINAGNLEGFLNTAVLHSGETKVALTKDERDDLGYSHLRYTINYNGVPVANRIIIAHLQNNNLVSINGDLTPPSEYSGGFTLSESAALQSALSKINAKKYMWEDPAEAVYMRESLNDPNFTYQPTGKKTYYEHEGKLVSAWQFNIYAAEPLYRANVYVNASNGQVIAEEDLICHADVPGTAVTKYSGSRAITNDQVNSSTFRLKESVRGIGNGVETRNLNNGTSFANSTDFINSTANWPNTGFNQGAHDAHWGAEMTYDYFWTQHNRNSINNAGFKLLSYIHYGNNYSNAFWDGQRMTYGDGNGTSMNIFTTLDICGHEITHGLTGNTAQLVYQNESGALNESWSDIFGNAIENFARPTQWNWRIGEDMTPSGWGLRSMSNPNSGGQPDTYLGSSWYTGTNDNGGVHTNSGVGNYWFYLLTTGGTGTNDLGNPYNVSSIGIQKAARIAFRALTVYFTPSTNYANARILCIQSAKDLYGACSNEVMQTANAWYAVGVGAQYNNSVTGANFYASNTTHCNVPANVSFVNTTANGNSYAWDFGDGTTSTGTNVAHTYTAPGTYNVKLKAQGCSGLDSIVRSSYVTIAIPTMPVIAPVSGCVNSTVALNASGNGSILWFDSATSGTATAAGTQFVTPVLNNSTTYYVSNAVISPAVTGGMASPTGGGYLNNSGMFLTFDVMQNSTLNSVVVDAQLAGNRTIQLRNAANTILNSVTINLTPGTHTVTLNFPLTPGLNYRLGLANASISSLYRTTSGVSYPYNVGNAVKITSSSAGTATYPFFYKWNVSVSGCSSPKIPVNVILSPQPLVSLSASQLEMCLNEEMILDANPVGGVFQGGNMTSSTFNATIAGPGLHPVQYTYTDANGCSATAYVQLKVDECTGINESSASSMKLWPNPATDRIQIQSSIVGSVSITDAAGRVISVHKLTGQNQQISLQDVPNGLYLVQLKDVQNNTLMTEKIIKQ